MRNKAQSGLLGINEARYEELSISEELAWLRLRIAQFVKGGVYLLAGEPGIGKSTLAIQIALDLGRSGKRTVYVLTEQSKEDLAKRARLMTAAFKSPDAEKALGNIDPEDNIYDIESLPSFLGHQILSPSGKYHGVDLVVIDSVQGQGLAATATSKYRQVYEFCRQCKAANITVVLVCHVTKRGEIAGPKDMEHNVDCVLVMRKAMIYRPMFVPKNRFGPAVLKPIPLQLDRNTTALSLAPHSESVSTVARTYLGPDPELPEVQAAVSLPSYGTHGKITAPNLPRKEIEQIANCISQIPDMNIEDLDYTIHCRLPGEKRFRPMLGLPLAMALVASYLQRSIPRQHVYIGEIDLLRHVRQLPEQLIMELAESIESGMISPPVRVFLPPNGAEMLRGLTKKAVVVACPQLDDAVKKTWPDMFAGE